MFIYKALSKLPFRALYLLSDISSFTLFHIVRYRRRVSYNNLCKCFPDKNQRQINTIHRSAYRNLTDTFLEILKAKYISDADIISRVTFKDFEEIQQLVQNKQSVFVLTAHTAPVEWISFAAHLKYDFVIDPVYKPVHSKKLDKYIYTIRSRHQSTPIPYKKLAKDVILRKSVNRSIAMLADLEPRSRDQVLEVNFLGQTTRFFLGNEKIIRLANLPTFFIAIKKISRGHYEASAQRLCSKPKTLKATILTQKYAKCIEKLILENPSAWLWTHKRWKHTI